ncbi:MAG: four helix bundle protein [Patescibacteria group bacterium]|nr:four helix bundle protein [Patescibacteria group bacterium]
MTEIQNFKQYDLEDRTLKFAQKVRIFVKKIPKTVANMEDGKQVIRSSGSVGANYIEANEALSRKDFLMRIKISRKESKESRYWLTLIYLDNNQLLENDRSELIQESTELVKIFSSILNNSE